MTLLINCCVLKENSAHKHRVKNISIDRLTKHSDIYEARKEQRVCEKPRQSKLNKLVTLLYTDLTISSLTGRKCTVRFRNQHLWCHLAADYTIIMSRTLKVVGNRVMYESGAWFIRVIMSSSLALWCLPSVKKLTSTLIILAITKTSSNNCLMFCLRGSPVSHCRLTMISYTLVFSPSFAIGQK